METTAEHATNTAVNDRRRDSRTRVSGQVHLSIKDTDGSVICADLLDFSRCGVRVRYEGAYLRPGSWIGICYEWGEVPAKVIWTAITGVKRETGLVVSSSECAG
jgi:hypothetical protein